MSNSLDSEFDLEQHFLPAWAKQTDANRFARFQGNEEHGGGRPGRRREGGGRPDRGDRGGSRPPRPGGDRGDRRGGPGPRGDRSGPRREGDRGRGYGRDQRDEPRPALPPLPAVEVTILPEDKGVEALARQIKLTGRAYPLFDIGFLVIKKPERYVVKFETVKQADGTPKQPLYVCRLDETLWLSEAEAATHILARHFDTFYQSERIETEKPKGVYTFVAQCGMSGEVLGPPNYHDYQNKLRKLHAERFGRMPFEAYKARVKIVRDEEIVKKWLDDQSWRTEYVPLNVPDPVKLPNREAVEKHFRETHLANVVQAVEAHVVPGAAAQQLACLPLRALFRRNLEEQLRFPLKLVTHLSQQFAGHGLQFFKVDKTVTHVSVARPHYLDLAATPVSDSIRRLIEFIEHTQKCTRRKIYDALAPAAPAPAPVEGQPAAEPVMTPEQVALNNDLHWLIHQGHVIEFANGVIQTARRPGPKPEKPVKFNKHAYLPVFLPPVNGLL